MFRYTEDTSFLCQNSKPIKGWGSLRKAGPILEIAEWGTVDKSTGQRAALLATYTNHHHKMHLMHNSFRSNHSDHTKLTLTLFSLVRHHLSQQLFQKCIIYQMYNFIYCVMWYQCSVYSTLLTQYQQHLTTVMIRSARYSHSKSMSLQQMFCSIECQEIFVASGIS